MRLSFKHWALLGALGATACAGPDELGQEEDVALGEQSHELQLDYAFNGYAQVITNTTAAQAKSTAAIRSVNPLPNMNHASCGATFVSKHYAVTAAHCVDDITLDTESVEVEQYTTSNLNLFGLMFGSSQVSGTWPNWTMGAPLGSWDGYSVTPMSCRVRRRCHQNKGGRQLCPAQLTAAFGDVDIALLHCSTRNSTFYATTTNIDTVGRDVETWWFHEILSLPAAPNPNDERWLHYGMYPAGGNYNDNYHYRVRHQLMPLQSTSRPRFFNTPLNYKDIGNSGAYTSADTPICHGTSGSGVFLNGQNVLIGPYVGGGPVWTAPNGTTYPLLCHQADQVQAGQPVASHVRASATHLFVTNSPEVLSDR